LGKKNQRLAVSTGKGLSGMSNNLTEPANEMSLKDLYDGVKVVAQFSTRDNETGCAPDWGKPKTVTLYVVRAEKDLKKGKLIRPAGTIVELAVKEFDFASYTENDYCEEYKEFVFDNYRMRILKILETKKVNMATSKTTTTVDYPVGQINKIISEKLFSGLNVKIEYVIQEVNSDPMDRFPGRNEVTNVRISFDGTPPGGFVKN